MAEHQGPVTHPIHKWESEMKGLDWSKGLTKQDVLNQIPAIDKSYFDKCPAGKSFNSYQEFWDCVKPEMTGPGANISPGTRGSPPNSGRG